ncbi:MAG: hypothetical protein ACUVRU_10330 [Anaerolineae bacterium]
MRCKNAALRRPTSYRADVGPIIPSGSEKGQLARGLYAVQQDVGRGASDDYAQRLQVAQVTQGVAPARCEHRSV